MLKKCQNERSMKSSFIKVVHDICQLQHNHDWLPLFIVWFTQNWFGSILNSPVYFVFKSNLRTVCIQVRQELCSTKIPIDHRGFINIYVVYSVRDFRLFILHMLVFSIIIFGLATICKYIAYFLEFRRN